MPAVRNPRVYTRARASTRFISPSSSQTDPASSPPGTPSKRALVDLGSSINSPSKRRRAFTLTSKTSHNKISLSKAVAKPPQKQSTLVQLHLLPDKPTLRECKLCGLSYTHAAAEDERVHRAHCLRVRKGMEWGREEERALGLDELEEVAKGVRLKHGKSGRIVCFRADLEGKMGRKFAILMETVNLALSSPPLTPAAIKASKAYLFLVPSTSSSNTRESIAGVVIAQGITSALAVSTSPTGSPPTNTSGSSPSHISTSVSSTSPSSTSPANLIPVHIDCATSLYLNPTPLPTPLGISRLFVSSSHRRQGIAYHLLEAAARTFVHGCELDPAQGEVAFSQPTAMGRRVMESWGGSGCRIYEE